jgi:hypothetical protein
MSGEQCEAASKERGLACAVCVHVLIQHDRGSSFLPGPMCRHKRMIKGGGRGGGGSVCDETAEPASHRERTAALPVLTIRMRWATINLDCDPRTNSATTLWTWTTTLKQGRYEVWLGAGLREVVALKERRTDCIDHAVF